MSEPTRQTVEGYSRQTTGQTFMGNRIITKWCSCDGYKDQEDQ